MVCKIWHGKEWDEMNSFIKSNFSEVEYMKREIRRTYYEIHARVMPALMLIVPKLDEINTVLSTWRYEDEE